MYLLTTTEGCQLLILPIGFQHFQEQKVQNYQLSFITFLTASYLHGSLKNVDYEKDMQVPVKKVTHARFAGISITVPSITTCLPSPGECVLTVNGYMHNDRFIPSHKLDDIFQPPRL